MAGNEIKGYECKNCGRLGHIAGRRCLSCKGTEFEEIKLGDKAVLRTYTQIYNIPAGVNVDPPLMIGLLEFDNGVKVVGQLNVDDPEDLGVGKKFEPEWSKLREIQGKEVFGFRFKLVESSKEG